MNALLSLYRVGATLGLLTLAGLSAAFAQSQPATDAATSSQIYTQAQRWLDDNLSKNTGITGLPLRMQVTLGTLDRSLRLAPCTQIDPYLPVGNRLWGKTRLGLRCAQGTGKWNVFLPVTVSAFGPAWVVKGQVASGAVLSASDAMAVEVDWAEWTSPIVANQSDWVGHTASRMLTTGQALRQDMIKSTQVFQAGAFVRVLGRGPGFEIATNGQAISAGVVGESAKVKMDNGRTLSGMVVDERSVRVDL